MTDMPGRAGFSPAFLDMRYRLQRKTQRVMPNVLGNHSFPVYTYYWKDIAVSDDLMALKRLMPNDKDYRIEDTRKEIGEDGDGK